MLNVVVGLVVSSIDEAQEALRKEEDREDDPCLRMAEEIGQLRAPIVEYLTQATVEFIVGRRDANNDADWEKFLSDLESLNYQRWFELYTQAAALEGYGTGVTE